MPQGHTCLHAYKTGLCSILTVYLFIKQTVRAIDEGLTLEISAFLPLTMANLRFQLSC